MRNGRPARSASTRAFKSDTDWASAGGFADTPPIIYREPSGVEPTGPSVWGGLGVATKRWRSPSEVGRADSAGCATLWRIPQDCRRVGSRMAGEQLRVTEG